MGEKSDKESEEDESDESDEGKWKNFFIFLTETVWNNISNWIDGLFVKWKIMIHSWWVQSVYIST